MKQVSITQPVDASPEKIWNILRTGTNLDKWIPFISACKLEGKGVGAKRVCTTADGLLIQNGSARNINCCTRHGINHLAFLLKYFSC